MSVTPESSPAPIESWEVLDLLTALVQKSLVVYEEDEQGQGRYRLLETVRQYARDRLLEASEAEAVRDRHRDWFVALAEQAEPKIRFGSEQVAWLDRLEREHDNLRMALEWCHGSDEGREVALRMAGALTDFWTNRGHTEEGWQRMESALAVGSHASAAARGRALCGAILTAEFRREEGVRSDDRMATLAAEGLALGRQAGDNRLIAHSLLGMGWAAYWRGDEGQAATLYEEGLALAREVGDRWLIASLRRCVAYSAQLRGEYELARTGHQEALTLSRELGDAWGIAAQHWNQGLLAQQEGNHDQARALYREALALFRGLGDRMRVIASLAALAHLALEQGDYGTAGACYEEALAMAREQRTKPSIAEALSGLATVAQAQGNDERVRAFREEARALYQELGNKSGEANLCMGEGHQLLERGDTAAARSCFEEGLALRRSAADTGNIAWALLEAGHAAWVQGEPGVTRSHAVEASALFREQGNEEGLLAVLESLGATALAEGRPERAARLLGAAEARREGHSKGLSGPDWWRRPRERIGAVARAASLSQAFAAAWVEGRGMTLESAVGAAFEEVDPG